MPRLTVLMLRFALVYLALGFTFGGLLLIHKGVPLSPWLWSLLPAHIEFLLLGWTVQLAMGVAFWILPRFNRAPRRGNEKLAWLAFGLLNLGVLLAGIGPLVIAPSLAVFLGRTAEAGAALAFAAHAWPRVKAFGV
jgi:heme/copper-type cytochrome/quinol oxidase subunit 1